ncbi:hypothetical protein GWK47_013777 [Chionoecetes opilio]|uniref:Uncharacterized protein n=1 Tax=Chionoecetes opilio TaxID=41210 RepID=A0A8J4XV62_CHIOP|nr:hypothetical protein GWK47_013777 [Chionoecetes opilio]
MDSKILSFPFDFWVFRGHFPLRRRRGVDSRVFALRVRSNPKGPGLRVLFSGFKPPTRPRISRPSHPRKIDPESRRRAVETVKTHPVVCQKKWLGCLLRLRRSADQKRHGYGPHDQRNLRKGKLRKNHASKEVGVRISTWRLRRGLLSTSSGNYPGRPFLDRPGLVADGGGVPASSQIVPEPRCGEYHGKGVALIQEFNGSLTVGDSFSSSSKGADPGGPRGPGTMAHTPRK